MTKDLEVRVEAIEARNRRVELDKAWENSSIRRLVLFFVTLAFTYVFLEVINDERPLGNAVLAAAGFVLSTLTVSYLKKWWISRQ